MKRAVLSAVAAYAVWTVIWLGGSAGLEALWPTEFEQFAAGQPMTAVDLLLVTLGLALVASIAAGATVARAAPGAVSRGLIVLAVLLLVTGVGVQASVWSLMPVWYHLLFLLLLVPGCFLGAEWGAARRGAGQAG